MVVPAKSTTIVASSVDETAIGKPQPFVIICAPP